MSVKQQEKTIVIERLRPPKMYCCVLHNDDITTMDFVVMVLVTVFHKSEYEAARLMMNVHNNGREIVGVYCYDIAVTKKRAVDVLAKIHNFPLLTTVEEADAE